MKRRGIIDPATLLTIGVVGLSLLAGTLFVRNQDTSQEIRTQAATDPCKICRNHLCVEVDNPPSCAISLNECSTYRDCQPQQAACIPAGNTCSAGDTCCGGLGCHVGRCQNAPAPPPPAAAESCSGNLGTSPGDYACGPVGTCGIGFRRTGVMKSMPRGLYVCQDVCSPDPGCGTSGGYAPSQQQALPPQPVGQGQQTTAPAGSKTVSNTQTGGTSATTPKRYACTSNDQCIQSSSGTYENQASCLEQCGVLDNCTRTIAKSISDTKCDVIDQIQCGYGKRATAVNMSWPNQRIICGYACKPDSTCNPAPVASVAPQQKPPEIKSIPPAETNTSNSILETLKKVAETKPPLTNQESKSQQTLCPTTCENGCLVDGSGQTTCVPYCRKIIRDNCDFATHECKLTAHGGVCEKLPIQSSITETKTTSSQTAPPPPAQNQKTNTPSQQTPPARITDERPTQTTPPTQIADIKTPTQLSPESQKNLEQLRSALKNPFIAGGTARSEAVLPTGVAELAKEEDVKSIQELSSKYSAALPSDNTGLRKEIDSLTSAATKERLEDPKEKKALTDGKKKLLGALEKVRAEEVKINNACTGAKDPFDCKYVDNKLGDIHDLKKEIVMHPLADAEIIAAAQILKAEDTPEITNKNILGNFFIQISDLLRNQSNKKDPKLGIEGSLCDVNTQNQVVNYNTDCGGQKTLTCHPDYGLCVSSSTLNTSQTATDTSPNILDTFVKPFLFNPFSGFANFMNSLSFMKPEIITADGLLNGRSDANDLADIAVLLLEDKREDENYLDDTSALYADVKADFENNLNVISTYCLSRLNPNYTTYNCQQRLEEFKQTSIMYFYITQSELLTEEAFCRTKPVNEQSACIEIINSIHKRAEDSVLSSPYCQAYGGTLSECNSIWVDMFINVPSEGSYLETCIQEARRANTTIPASDTTDFISSEMRQCIQYFSDASDVSYFQSSSCLQYIAQNGAQTAGTQNKCGTLLNTNNEFSNQFNVLVEKETAQVQEGALTVPGGSDNLTYLSGAQNYFNELNTQLKECLANPSSCTPADYEFLGREISSFHRIFTQSSTDFHTFCYNQQRQTFDDAKLCESFRNEAQTLIDDIADSSFCTTPQLHIQCSLAEDGEQIDTITHTIPHIDDLGILDQAQQQNLTPAKKGNVCPIEHSGGCVDFVTNMCLVEGQYLDTNNNEDYFCCNGSRKDGRDSQCAGITENVNTAGAIQSVALTNRYICPNPTDCLMGQSGYCLLDKQHFTNEQGTFYCANASLIRE